MNNFEKIKNMTLDEMAKFIYLINPMYCTDCPAYNICKGGECVKTLKQWLQQENNQ